MRAGAAPGTHDPQPGTFIKWGHGGNWQLGAPDDARLLPCHSLNYYLASENTSLCFASLYFAGITFFILTLFSTCIGANIKEITLYAHLYRYCSYVMHFIQTLRLSLSFAFIPFFPSMSLLLLCSPTRREVF